MSRITRALEKVGKKSKDDYRKEAFQKMLKIFDGYNASKISILYDCKSKVCALFKDRFKDFVESFGKGVVLSDFSDNSSVKTGLIFYDNFYYPGSYAVFLIEDERKIPFFSNIPDEKIIGGILIE